MLLTTLVKTPCLLACWLIGCSFLFHRSVCLYTSTTQLSCSKCGIPSWFSFSVVCPHCVSFASFVKWTPKYFTLIDTIVNGIVFLLFHIVCRCMGAKLIFMSQLGILQLCCICRLVLNYFVWTLGFSLHRTMSSAQLELYFCVSHFLGSKLLHLILFVDSNYLI